MKEFILGALALLTCLSLVSPAPAQTYTISWHKVAGGGGTGAGGIYSVSGTAGQWDSGRMTGGNLSLNGGFWSAVSVIGGGTSTLPEYKLVDLGVAGEDVSAAYAINNAGQIVGSAGGGPAFWTNSSSPAVGLDVLGTPFGINDAGQIVGFGEDAVFWSNSSSPALDLGTFGPANWPGLSSRAYGINGSGQIVGYAIGHFAQGDSSYYYEGAAYWTNSQSPPFELGGVGNKNQVANAINDSGQIVGHDASSGTYSAVVWTSMHDSALELHNPVGYASGFSDALGINASGQIVGFSQIAGAGMFWTNYLSPGALLGRPAGSTGCFAQSINASGQIVGWSYDETGTDPHAVLWLNNAAPPIDLNSLIPTNSGWVLSQAYGINDSGEIVGFGRTNGMQRAFALKPLNTATMPTTVARIAAGIRHSLFLGPGASLWAMGMNEFGCLGDGTTTEHDTPEQILPSGVTSVAAGIWHSLFLKSDGSLWAMGYNGYGALGDGTSTDRATPVQIVPNSVTAIAAGFYHSLFLKSDGSLWAMGYNVWGQLGDGTTTDAHTPEQIVSSGVTAIAVGFVHSLFLKSDGSLWGMGNSSYEGYGALGDGTSTSSPKQIVSSGVTAIAAGQFYSLFLKSDGSLWAMGYNADGQLGDGTTNSAGTPEQIVPGGVTAIVAGGFFDGQDSLFLKSDGSLWAMGYNLYGQLGDGTTNGTHIPKQIVCSGVAAMAAGLGHTLFVKSDGSLWGMGYNYGGQLGDGTTTNRHTPERIVGSGPIPALLITAVARVGYTLQLSFVSDACHSYNILTTSDLASGAWSTILTGVPGNGALVQLTIPSGFNQPQQFFRIQQAE